MGRYIIAYGIAIYLMTSTDLWDCPFTLPFQIWFFKRSCCSWHDFNWRSASRGLSATAELRIV